MNRHGQAWTLGSRTRSTRYVFLVKSWRVGDKIMRKEGRSYAHVSNIRAAGLHSAVGSASHFRSRGHKLESQFGLITSVDMIRNNFYGHPPPIPLVQAGQLSVTGEIMCTSTGTKEKCEWVNWSTRHDLNSVDWVKLKLKLKTNSRQKLKCTTSLQALNHVSHWGTTDKFKPC